MSAVAVVDYGIGNLRSAERALRAVGADARLVSAPEALEAADGIVVPGVGAFGPASAALSERGLAAALRAAIGAGVPFLGICVGCQLLFQGSEEDPGAVGLGVFPGHVRRLPAGTKLPQMQWNQLVFEGCRPSRLFPASEVAPWFYFVHSFAPEPGPETIARCDYGGPVVAAVEKGNVAGTQFHPEKSGPVGLALLARWLRGAGLEVTA